MSTQSKRMAKLDLKTYVKVVAAVFAISAATAFVLALLRMIHPSYYYLTPLTGSNLVTHYVITGIMLVTSSLGFLNSCVVLRRPGADNVASNITLWLLLDSLFETSRIVYLFIVSIVIKGKGTMQVYELIISALQYYLDGSLFNFMILKH